MLKKLAPIVSILLITSNACANHPAQEALSTIDPITRKEHIRDGLIFAGFAVLFGRSANLDCTKNVTGFASLNKRSLCWATLTTASGALALYCFASAVRSKDQASVAAAPISAQGSLPASKLLNTDTMDDKKNTSIA